MSAKNSADALPARKIPVLYFFAFSGPAMSEYVLRAGAWHNLAAVIGAHRRQQSESCCKPQQPGGPALGAPGRGRSLFEVFVEAKLARALDGVAEQCGEPAAEQARDARLPHRELEALGDALVLDRIDLHTRRTVSPGPCCHSLLLNGAGRACMLHLTTSSGVTAVWVRPQLKMPPMVQAV